MPAPLPITNWGPGQILAPYSQFSFGSYVFPLTCQMKDNNVKIASDRKHIPFGWGDHIPPNASVGGRDIELIMDVGSMIVGTSGLQLHSAADLRAERNQLAKLQIAGRQPLWTSDDRYCWAYLSEFDDAPFQDGGVMRYSTWDLKFIADDPRYYSTTLQENTFSINNTGMHTMGISHLGNVRAYPRIIITCLGNDNTIVNGVTPSFAISGPRGTIGVRLSTLTMFNQDVLTINCDPRPEHRSAAVVLTSKGQSYNGLKFIRPLIDLTNDLDFSEVFPYIETTDLGGAQVLGVQILGNPNCTVDVVWNDTWM